MKFSKTSKAAMLLIFVLFSTSAYTQNTELKIKSAALEIINSSKTCALITIDENGLPRVRAMDPFLPEKDFTVWFGTNPMSRKVNQIKNDERVTLYYMESDNSGYVMIQGKAALVNNKKQKEKYWKKQWEAFYPDKDENYLLIKVTPLRMEISSEKRGIKGNPKTWEPASVVFN